MQESDKALIRLGFVEPAYLVVVGLLLLGAFISVGGDLGLRAPVLLVALAWALHLAVGLAAIRLSVIGLSRWPPTARWPDLLLLLVAGLFASCVLALMSFVVDQWLLAQGIDTDDEPLVSLAGIPAGLLEEWTHTAPPSVLVAILLGLPAWWARRQATTDLVSPPGAEPDSPAADPGVTTASGDESGTVLPAGVRSCLQRLPPALGTDLIAARAELQYVRIYTTRGDALVLGALKDVAEQQAPTGQLVHRSWWVATRHVRTLRRRGARYVLTLANGLEVPVSRRRQPELVRQFGSSTTLN